MKQLRSCIFPILFWGFLTIHSSIFIKKSIISEKLFINRWKSWIFICNDYLVVSLYQCIRRALYLHFPLSMKNRRIQNFVDKKKPLSMENLHCLWNVLFMKYSIYEMSYLWNVLSMKCLSMKWLPMKCLVYEMTYLWNDFLWNVLSMKCPNAKNFNQQGRD